MIIAIDFDGTCVMHEYPKIGEDIGAVPVLKEITDKGHKFILYTMRSGKELQDAVDWFKSNGIPLYSVNNNPLQYKWTESPKVYANLYIDDTALGIPLLQTKGSKVCRPYVDWEKVRELLVDKHIL